MTRQDLISTIKEYFDEQVNRGNLAEAPEAAELAWYLIGKGVTVSPCKVGDKIYWIDVVSNKAREFTVVEVDEAVRAFSAVEDATSRTRFGFDEFGDMVFSTREEAELALEANREKHLNELREYYRSEEEWESLAQLERELEEAEN